MRTPATLKTRFFCKSADECHLLGSFQRKDIFIIFQKNHGFFCNVAGLLVIFFHSEFLRSAVVDIFKNNTKNTFHGLIQDFFFQRTVFYSGYDQSIIGSA